MKQSGPALGVAERVARAGLYAWAGLSLSACSGELLTLGHQPAAEYSFGTPERLEELYAGQRNENPTLTADGLEIFYTSRLDGGGANVWHATRDSSSVPFENPAVIDSVSSPDFDTSPAISSDGLTLWVASEREGGQGALDIWVSARASRSDVWPAPVPATALNSQLREIPRPPGAHGLIMPLSSDRDGSEDYWIYLARRPSTDSSFGTPELVDSLSDPERTSTDACLTDDGLRLFYAAGPIGGLLDLYVSERSSLDDDFGPGKPLAALNTEADERDPWLSPDGALLYFASDRDGILDLYKVSVLSAGGS